MSILLNDGRLGFLLLNDAEGLASLLCHWSRGSLPLINPCILELLLLCALPLSPQLLFFEHHLLCLLLRLKNH